MTTKIPPELVDDQVFSRRNLIINGDMRVAQRSTSVTGTTGFYTVDRWRTYSTANVTTSQQAFTYGQTDVPNFPKNYLRLVPSSATFTLSQRVEDVTVLGGKEVTLSFWIKGSAAQTFGIQHTRYYGSGGSSAESTTVATNFNVTTSWTKVTSTFTVPSITGKTINTGNYFQLTIGGGGEFTSSNTIEITQVQLEVGDTATPFEHRSFGEELSLCQRYFTNIAYNTTWFMDAYLGGDHYSTQNLIFPTQMRTSPTNNPAIDKSDFTRSNVTEAELKIHVTGQNGFIFQMRATSTGRTYVLANTTGSLSFDAEL